MGCIFVICIQRAFIAAMGQAFQKWLKPYETFENDTDEDIGIWFPWEVKDKWTPDGRRYDGYTTRVLPGYQHRMYGEFDDNQHICFRFYEKMVPDRTFYPEYPDL